MSNQLQQYPHQRNLRNRQPDYRPLQFQPPTCGFCGNPYVKPFSSIYGRGTTFYTKIKGLLLKHGYERTKRQSVLANKCSPPMSLPWFPAILFTLLLLGAHWAATHWYRFSYSFLLVAYYLSWAALLSALITGINNFAIYPARLAKWSSSYFCERCGSVTYLDHP